MSINKKVISILGSTGSIGTQTLDVVRKNPEMFKIEGISTNKNIELLSEQIHEFKPSIVTIFNEETYKDFLNKKEDFGYDFEVHTGLDGLVKISSSKTIDTLITAVVGMIGLVPTIQAIKNSTTIALANKETLVTAGKIVMSEAKKHNASIIPVDSEHSAIFQCLNGENGNKIDKILLTASGGPFRGKKRAELENVSKNDALKHPNWTMGQKITIDSSTLMNKGLEVIEAKWLFDVDADDIIVHVHPQSIIHSMVQFQDSTVMAQLGCPDMRVPIQYALTYPKRIESSFERLDLFEIASLTFEKADMEIFPCLKLAYDSLKHGGTDCTVLNAANEILVQMFLNDEIGFYDIPKYIKLAIDKHQFIEDPSLEDILNTDKWTRDFIKKTLK
ncbi:1-deoxy-D-xylulose 5-phosphate reductoisomerase [Peptostreptococcus russellii]|uniref:1-deoxy-D-xylulose 5-phosphate reductoisomerase n=2 Tax=Peptostreptococcus russellii TaxID=215200 RepID=A0A1H8IF26_9FIRM|nr:1-deoxy-D-xylulose-5-phosphate reductoisomerase [Peptostreptococcus russellii]SEN67323.1 1-deoxy-D-xylulose 5-phosphate reductoisomerase [Peptostreptococcus russellii]